METRRVGSLEVSVAGLGCNNFGMRIDEDASQAGRRRRARRRRQPLRHRRHLRQGPVGGVPRARARQPPRRRRDHHQGRACGAPEGEHGGSEAYVTRHVRREPRPPRHRLHRPLPPAPARSRDADRARRSPRSPSSSPRARCARSAARTSAARSSRRPSGRATELGVPRFVNVQNDYSLLEPRGRSRRAPGVRAARHRAHALLPAGERRAHRQVPARRGRTPRARGSRRGATDGRACSPATSSSTSSSGSTEYAEAHGHTLPELALSWLAGTPAVGSVIAGATSPEQVRANAAATTAWALTDAERAEVDALARVGG